MDVAFDQNVMFDLTAYEHPFSCKYVGSCSSGVLGVRVTVAFKLGSKEATVDGAAC